MAKVIITPSSFGQCGEKPIEILREKGYEVVNNPYGRRLTEEETIDLGQGAMGVVAGVENYNKRVLDELPDLKCISRVGVGLDSIDLDYTEKKGIIIKNTPDGPTSAVAELSLALALDLLRRISYVDRSIRKGRWEKYIGRLINNKVVGIIGLGRIGKETAKLYQSVGCQIIAHDIHPDKEWAARHDIIFKSLEKVLEESDIISLHVSTSPKDGALIGKEQLAKLPPEAVLINLARGGVVNEEALYDFLSKNPDSFAAVDVFNNEPYNGPLVELDNVLLTPHLGSYAREAKLGMEIKAVQNLINALN